MPGKVKSDGSRSGKEHRSTKLTVAQPVQHESQRVKTEKPTALEERKTKKESSHKTRSNIEEERPSKYPDLGVSDSRKVSFGEQTKREEKKLTKGKPDESSRKKRSDEMALPDFEEDNTSKSKKAVTKKPATPEEADAYDYEDDFEQEYQDDFDDEAEDEAEEKVVASHTEVKKVSSPPEQVTKRAPLPLPLEDDDYEKVHKSETKRKPAIETTAPLSSRAQPSIGLNFKAAIQKTSRLSRRANELLRLVTLDVARVDFFDFPVVSEYDLYIMSYGKANRKQTAVQTFDDAVSREAQTDNIESSYKWTQIPPTDDDEHSGGEIRRKNKKEASSKKNADPEKMENFTEFVKDAGSAMIFLLEDVATRQSAGVLRKTGGAGGKRRMETKFGATFGSKIISFSQDVILGEDDGYFLERIYFPPDSSSYLITLHAPKDGDISFAKQHKIAIWNTDIVTSVSKPTPKIVVSTGVRVTCVAMESGLSPELLFVGHFDGSLAVWDFRLAFSTHAASFRSAAVVATNQTVFTASDTHLTPLKCLLPLPLSTGSSLTESQAGLRCELLSLDESGLLATWAVADLGAGSNRVMNDDPAVLPGGRIRLLRSSYGNIKPSMSPTDGLLEPTCIINHPTSPSRVLVGLSSGDTLHVARYGNRQGSGGLSSGHPNIYKRKFVSPVLNLAHFLNVNELSGMTAGNDVVGAFIASTALGFSIYVTSRSQSVLNFDTDPSQLLHAFPISTACALSVLGSTSSSGILATVAALTTDAKLQLYQIGPKFSNQWSGASTELATPSASPSSRAAGNGSGPLMSLLTSLDSSGGDADAGGAGSRRYLTAVAFTSGAIDLYLTDNVDGADTASVGSGGGAVSPTAAPQSPDSQQRSAAATTNQQDLIEYLLNVV